ncbi:MAG TPA: M28 family peptidase [Vicinamibacterales bacterium]|nr:M28 family peptidase [Vicinamibacterales bacterium]
MPLRRTAALLAIWCACAAPAARPAPARVPDAVVRAIDAVSTADLRTYVETLASDRLKGRGVGEAGNRQAEEFICDALRRNGVTPAGADGSCYQPVEIAQPSLGPRSRLLVTRGDGSTLQEIRGGSDFYPLPDTGSRAASGPLVSAGYGITSAERSHDDYAGVDARGAIVMILDGAPEPLRGDRQTVFASKVQNATAHGARGLLVVTENPAAADQVWPERGSRSATYRLASDLRSAPPLATLSAKAAQPLRDALARGATLEATLAPDVEERTVTVRNVLGLVEGRDPARRGEMIVVGAHLDHDGTDAQGRIYNGADDNASGTAAVIAAAAAMARAAAAGERPARSVLFALWNGEEKGSLGAFAFVAAPQPARRVVANLNLDMVGRNEEVPNPADWRFAGMPKVSAASSVNTLHVLGYSYSPDLAADLREANEAIGLTLKEDYDYGIHNLVQRSDQWPFLSRGIPALFLTTGLHPDYHTPDDDAARIDFGKLTRVARLAARAAWIVADDAAEPALKKR